MLCASLEGRGAWGRMDIYMCIYIHTYMCHLCIYIHIYIYAESPETITTLFFSYTPIQNVSSVRKIKIKFKKSCFRNFKDYHDIECTKKSPSFRKIFKDDVIASKLRDGLERHEGIKYQGSKFGHEL